MTTIDHRILIPAAPDVVWNYVSDITHNPDWQIDCQEVIFLTSRREGPGVRWRYAAPGGRECVIAVTAWYNGLGYEYYFVDGMPFRENKGRIRLQEIPEGTIVQWTFTYELGGVLGGMRNALGMSRQVDHTIADSLKTLWQKIKNSTGPSRVYEAKSLMRDAPDVEARKAYQRRHPSPAAGGAPGETVPTSPQVAKFTAEPPIHEDDGQPISVIDEPPIEEGDTRPRHPVTAADEAVPVPPDIEGEPEFLEQLVDLSRFEPPRAESDTQPRKPVAPEAEAAVETPAPPAADEARKGEETEPLGFAPPERLEGYPEPLVIPEPVYDTEEPTLSSAEVAEETQPDFEAQEAAEALEPTPAEEAPPVQPEVEQAAEPPVAEKEAPPAPETIERAPSEAKPEAPPVKQAQAASSDTASIWDVFGVPRPSETGEVAAVSAEPAPETVRLRRAACPVAEDHAAGRFDAHGLAHRPAPPPDPRAPQLAKRPHQSIRARTGVHRQVEWTPDHVANSQPFSRVDIPASGGNGY